MKEVRLGTIGSGTIVHSVLDGVKATEGIRLAAVYSRTEEKARALAEEYGCTTTYTDLEAFLGDAEVNTVYIATPNQLHYSQTKMALLAGKHVICEKPFCTRADQAEELAALAKEKGLFLVEAAPTSFLPNFEILKRELTKIGNVKLVIANYSQYSSRIEKLWAGEVPNIFNPAYAGGCLMDINFYNVYLTVALFGRPEEAVYYPNLFRIAGNGGQIDTSGVLAMRYDGFVSTCAGAKDTWGVNSFQIEGEKGYIYVTDGSNGLRELRVVTKTSEEVFNEQDNPDRWYYEVQRLTPLLLAEDTEALDKRLQITLDTVHVIEDARKKAGIVFPEDT